MRRAGVATCTGFRADDSGGPPATPPANYVNQKHNQRNAKVNVHFTNTLLGIPLNIYRKPHAHFVQKDTELETLAH